MTFESFIGLSGFALVAGLIFARFEQPHSKVIFSKQAVVGGHGDTDAFKLRMANGGQNELLDVDVKILLCMTETVDNVRTRRFSDMYREPRHGHMLVDLRRLHDIEEVQPRDALRQTLWEM